MLFNPREARRAGACVLKISRGEQNLDGSGKHSGASGPSPRVEQNSANRLGRGVDLALGETKQRQSRLGLSSAVVRACIGGVGLGELASKSIDLAETVERRTSGRPGQQQFTRVLRVPRGVTPVATQLQDFDAVHQAFAAIAHEIWLRGTPSRERRRPLVRTTQIEGFLTALQHAAVDVAGHDWRHVACDHRDHRFIEQRHAFGNVTETDEGAAASVARQRGEIAIGKPTSELRRLAEYVVDPGWVPLNDALNGRGYQQIAAPLVNPRQLPFPLIRNGESSE